MRADARRNYERLLDEARSAFAEFGVDASLDEIARRAGVASGTLYRHFPTRLDLVEAVLAGQIAALAELGRSSLTSADAFEALRAWLGAIIAHGVTYRGLAAEVMNSALSSSLVSELHAQLFEVGAALLDRAYQSGTIVAVDEHDVLGMAGGIAWAARNDAAQADRLLALLMNGLRQVTR
ncbi:MAG TPA: helix-turn-helix domain-containing protein [Kutzneria sp.]|nr:helix-turn-helix domain-containing protein [Kutzneria sp.]